MRCKEVQNELIESSGKQAPQLAEHLEHCLACRTFARDWRLTSWGFQAAAQEPVPEATLGFAERIVRLLKDPVSERRFGDQFLVGVGKRFVYAGLLVTLLLLLGLVLPSTGPLRGPTTAERYLARPETAAAWNDPLFSDDVQADQGAGLVRSKPEAVDKGVK